MSILIEEQYKSGKCFSGAGTIVSDNTGMLLYMLETKHLLFQFQLINLIFTGKKSTLYCCIPVDDLKFYIKKKKKNFFCREI
jgi:hypothetical protein